MVYFKMHEMTLSCILNNETWHNVIIHLRLTICLAAQNIVNVELVCYLKLICRDFVFLRNIGNVPTNSVSHNLGNIYKVTNIP